MMFSRTHCIAPGKTVVYAYSAKLSKCFSAGGAQDGGMFQALSGELGEEEPRAMMRRAIPFIEESVVSGAIAGGGSPIRLS